jgi:ankyrin repeat protein
MINSANDAGRFDRFRTLALDENIPGMAAMLGAGFDVNTTNGGQETALLHCCANDRFLAAKYLVSRGADVNLADHGGSTPLDFAGRHASRDFNDWLARAGGRKHGAGAYVGATAIL